MDYLLLKFVHILSATILFGTGLGSALFMFMANRRKNVHGIYLTARHVVTADWLLTTPAVIIQLLTGMGLVSIGGYAFTDLWIMSGLTLYLFAGACWIPVVWMQIRMRDMAKLAHESGQSLPQRYWRMERWWTILGSLAFPAVVIVFYLMVFKPNHI
ncbi:MAG: DUF2269 family protein [Alphaproteobacteria bacterium]|nr:DUF2269 family protein [Alphaproteobacteria bacterium]